MPYRVTFALGLFNGEKDRAISRAALAEMLRTLTVIDSLYLIAHPETPPLYKSGVRYMEEPPGQEDWQDISTCLRIGYGDCEDLACWRAAELNVRYKIAAWPFFREYKRPDGSYLYHIMVQYPDGRIGDPSKHLGMR
jgi:hypothetical protein